jgi:hypothetical protein
MDKRAYMPARIAPAIEAEAAIIMPAIEPAMEHKADTTP